MGHQSVTYDVVRQILSRPPDRRKDFEINNILPWFRSMKDTKVLGQLKPSILFDVIKNVQFITRNKDELVIRQGDFGDCMYVMLRGSVTIYHNYGNIGDGSGEDGDAVVAQTVASVKGEALRLQLGAFVVTLKDAGTAFGEVSLLTDNGIRSASIIADEPTDLIVIDRALYNRSVQCVLRREFEQKAHFIAQHPHFQSWAPKYRKQLTMALEKQFLSYDFIVTRQSAPVDAVYFIVSGEVKMTMDPQLHFSQFPKLFAAGDNGKLNSHSTAFDSDQVAQVLRTFNNNNKLTLPGEDGSRSSKRLQRRHQTVEMCLLGVNEAIGDIEALMGLPTYMQTSVCSQPCEVLVLDMKHYERLLVRRNPRTIDGLRQELELRIRSRIGSRYLTSTVPLLERLLERASDYQKRDTDVQDEAQSIYKKNKQQRAAKDAHTPGALFSTRTRQQQQQPASKVLIQKNVGSSIEVQPTSDEILAAVSVDYQAADHPPANATLLQTNLTGKTTTVIRGGGSEGGLTTQSVSAVTSTTAVAATSGPKVHSASLTDIEAADMEMLENRMLEWLIDDGRYRRRIAAAHEQRSMALPFQGKELTPRIIKLRRASTELEQLKPGAKIVMRRKQIVVTPYQYRERSAVSMSGNVASSQHQQQSAEVKDCSDAQLAYYRSALTDPVPVFARN